MYRFFWMIHEAKLPWWHVVAILVIALFVGIFVANYFFQNWTWEQLIKGKYQKSWRTDGHMLHNAFERYVATIFFTTLFVWVILISFVCGL